MHQKCSLNSFENVRLLVHCRAVVVKTIKHQWDYISIVHRCAQGRFTRFKSACHIKRSHSVFLFLPFCLPTHFLHQKTRLRPKLLGFSLYQTTQTEIEWERDRTTRLDCKTAKRICLHYISNSSFSVLFLHFKLLLFHPTACCLCVAFFLFVRLQKSFELFVSLMCTAFVSSVLYLVQNSTRWFYSR